MATLIRGLVQLQERFVAMQCKQVTQKYQRDLTLGFRFTNRHLEQRVSVYLVK